MSKTTVKILMVFLILLGILLVFLKGFSFWAETAEIVLYSDVTHNGYELKIVQQGIGGLNGRHGCVLLVNGEERLWFLIRHPDAFIAFPKQEIVCDYDNESGYRLLFAPDASGGMELCFDANFSEVVYARCHLVESLKEGFAISNFSFVQYR